MLVHKVKASATYEHAISKHQLYVPVQPVQVTITATTLNPIVLHVDMK